MRERCMDRDYYPVITPGDMRRMEEEAFSLGIGSLALMERAAAAVTDALERALDGSCQGKRVLFLCGKGNNGGDALVMARILDKHGVKSDILFIMGEKLSELSQTNRDRLPENTPIYLSGNIDFTQYDFIVDAVFGTGFSGSLPEHISLLFKQINELPTKRFALDIPTGINCDTGDIAPNTFQAQHTFAFGAYKPAHIMNKTQSHCGTVQVIDIGI